MTDRLAGLNRRPPGEDEVHLWRFPASYRKQEDIRENGRKFLSSEERARYAAMKRPDRARKFIDGRILLRRVAGMYLDREPGELSIVPNANGKPILLDAPAGAPAFSLSHSAEETVLAVGGIGDIGVDIETLSRSAAAERISEAFFTEQERHYLSTLKADRAERTLMLWVLKESIIKALGRNIAEGLAGISLAFDDPRIILNPSLHSDDSDWRLSAGKFTETSVLSIAQRLPRRTEHPSAVIRIFRLDEPGLQAGSFSPAFRN